MSQLAGLLERSVESFAERPALSYQGCVLTYGELASAVAAMRAHLVRSGIRAGERVCLVASNMPCLVIGLFAVASVEAIAVPLSARLRGYELQRTLLDAEASALISIDSYRGFSFSGLMAELLPMLPWLRCCLFVSPQGDLQREIQLDREPAREAALATEDIGLILYTSGTTGAPNGALIRTTPEIDGALEMNVRLDCTAADAVALIVPIAHAFALQCLLASIAAGSIAVLIESGFSLSPVLEAVQQQRITVLHASPALLAGLSGLMNEGDALLSTVRTGFVAGSLCPPDLIRGFDKQGTQFLNLYGMTEIGAACSCRLGDPPIVRYATAGQPFAGLQVKVDSDSAELLVRGPSVTPGYFRALESPSAFGDGWFSTGDLATIDDAGGVTILGRAKDVVHVGGFNVFPAEVEGLLLTHPDVMQAVVVGAPHSTMGEIMHAFVVPRPGANLTPPMLVQYARTRIAGYKIPYALELVATLPILSSGKPDRVALKQFVSL